MLVVNWMAKEVQTISPDTTLEECWKMLKNKAVHRLPVLDDDRHILGLLSCQDIEKLLPPQENGNEQNFVELLKGKTARDYMRKDPVTVGDGDSLEYSAQVMIKKDVDCLLVVDSSQKLCGIITAWDIFKGLVRLTGIDQPGIQMSFDVENRRGTLKSLIDTLKDHDVHIITVLTRILENGKRRINIRCRGMSEAGEDAAVNHLSKNSTMRYWVRGNETHIVTHGDEPLNII